MSRQAPQPKQEVKLKTQRTEVGEGNSNNNNPNNNQQANMNTQEVKQTPVKAENKVGRNDPCPCGSGKKFKNCHGA